MKTRSKSKSRGAVSKGKTSSSKKEHFSGGKRKVSSSSSKKRFSGDKRKVTSSSLKKRFSGGGKHTRKISKTKEKVLKSVTKIVDQHRKKCHPETDLLLNSYSRQNPVLYQIKNRFIDKNNCFGIEDLKYMTLYRGNSFPKRHPVSDYEFSKSELQEIHRFIYENYPELYSGETCRLAADRETGYLLPGSEIWKSPFYYNLVVKPEGPPLGWYEPILWFSSDDEKYQWFDGEKKCPGFIFIFSEGYDRKMGLSDLKLAFCFDGEEIAIKLYDEYVKWVNENDYENRSIYYNGELQIQSEDEKDNSELELFRIYKTNLLFEGKNSNQIQKFLHVILRFLSEKRFIRQSKYSFFPLYKKTFNEGIHHVIIKNRKIYKRWINYADKLRSDSKILSVPPFLRFSKPNKVSEYYDLEMSFWNQNTKNLDSIKFTSHHNHELFEYLQVNGQNLNIFIKKNHSVEMIQEEQKYMEEFLKICTEGLDQLGFTQISFL